MLVTTIVELRKTWLNFFWRESQKSHSCYDETETDANKTKTTRTTNKDDDKRSARANHKNFIVVGNAAKISKANYKNVIVVYETTTRQ